MVITCLDGLNFTVAISRKFPVGESLLHSYCNSHRVEGLCHGHAWNIGLVVMASGSHPKKKLFVPCDCVQHKKRVTFVYKLLGATQMINAHLNSE